MFLLPELLVNLKTGCSVKLKIAITIDAEDIALCSSALPFLLDILDKHEAKATFFVLGRLAEHDPNVPKLILSRDHELGCHGYKHDSYDNRGFDEVKADIRQGTKAIREFCQPRVFRSPYFRPHRRLAMILEWLEYEFDSSVPSKRFDLFPRSTSAGRRTSNPYNFLSPMRPYQPSKDNIFRTGQSEIVEIPLSCFFLPAIGSLMRNVGLTLFKTFIDCLSFFQRILVFDIHAWEFSEPHFLWRRKPIRHCRRTGPELISMFDKLLYNLRQKGEFVTISELNL